MNIDKLLNNLTNVGLRVFTFDEDGPHEHLPRPQPLDMPYADRFLREPPEDLDELGVELPPERAPE